MSCSLSTADIGHAEIRPRHRSLGVPLFRRGRAESYLPRLAHYCCDCWPNINRRYDEVCEISLFSVEAPADRRRHDVAHILAY